MRGLGISAALAALVALGAVTASAQEFPTKPIRIVVPFAAGGATDTTTRIIAEGMQKILGQPVVVENKPGGLGIIAIEEMAKANPDGHTLMMGSGMINGAVVAVHPDKFSINYDRDVTVVGRVADVPAVYVATAKNFPVSNFAELIDYAKKNPGKVRYCSTGPGTALHIEMSIFEKKQGVKLVHVPYPTGQTAPDLINGDLHFCSLNIIQARPMTKAGTDQADHRHHRKTRSGLPGYADDGGTRHAGAQRQLLGRAVRAGQDPAGGARQTARRDQQGARDGGGTRQVPLQPDDPDGVADDR